MAVPKTVETVVVMGIEGSGKSTLGGRLARALGLPFIEADEFHSEQSIAKMRQGLALNDDDRWPWLAAVRRAARPAAPAVVACSALTRAHRDALRLIGEVRFVWLRIAEADALARCAQRHDHFAGTALVASQLATLQPPEADEVDLETFEATTPRRELLSAVLAALAEPANRVDPQGTWGGADAELGSDDLDAIAHALAGSVIDAGAHRVLLVPPDQTRAPSRAGELTWRMEQRLTRRGCEVAMLPALGTHRAMDDDDAQRLFGGHRDAQGLLVHDWRHGVAELGKLPADEVVALSGGLLDSDVVVEVASSLLGEWDLVVSLGQVAPHEVAGLAGYTKNIVVGLGGPSFIGASHLLGALVGIETIMGEAANPVRDLVDTAFDRMVGPRLNVLFVLTVVEDGPQGEVLRAVLSGRGGTGRSGAAAFREAASLSQRANIAVVDEPWGRASCWLHAREYRSTWLGNKAVYRTRRALATGAELIVLAPGVERFGEDPEIDRLIRRHGYIGREAVLAAAADDAELRASPGTMAHLIHGSSEGRFAITYCTDPDGGGLTPEELAGVGYGWRPLAEELAHLGVDATTPTGPAVDAHGERFAHVARPSLGLWAAHRTAQ
jgi:carbohydrate kinase (thermoresistant glucokinase family)